MMLELKNILSSNILIEFAHETNKINRILNAKNTGYKFLFHGFQNVVVGCHFPLRTGSKSDGKLFSKGERPLTCHV